MEIQVHAHKEQRDRNRYKSAWLLTQTIIGGSAASGYLGPILTIRGQSARSCRGRARELRYAKTE